MSASTNNHNDRISITIVLAPAPAQLTGFGNVLFIADEASGTDLDGDRVRTYTTYADVATDVTAGDISAAVGVMASDFFSQRPQPKKLKIGRADTGGGESFADALAAIELVDGDYYGVCIQSRADADILSISAAIETRKKICVVQSDDADWKTSGLPSGLTGLAGRENTAVLYHTTDAEWADVCWLGSRLVFDPDDTSYPMEGAVKEVAAYATAPTAAEKAFLEANYANYGLPYGSQTFVVLSGVNCAGREMAHVITSHWLDIRVQADVIQAHLQHLARGEKLAVSLDGQMKLGAIVKGWFQRGEAVGHFMPGQTEVTFPALTTSDTTARRIPIDARAQLGSSAVNFDIDFNLSTTALTE